MRRNSFSIGNHVIHHSNWHRESPRGLLPATPPYKGVRIRRFGGLSGNQAFKGWQTKRLEVRNRQGAIDWWGSTHSPRTVRAASGAFSGLCYGQAQGSQAFESCVPRFQRFHTRQRSLRLQLHPLMTMDFAVTCPLVRMRLPHIRFLSVSSRICTTLLSDLGSRLCPCASLHFIVIRLSVDFHLQVVEHATGENMAAFCADLLREQKEQNKMH